MIQTEKTGVEETDDDAIKTATITRVPDPTKYKVPIYYGGITEDGKYVLVYDLVIKDNRVTGKQWKSKAVLNHKNFLRMMIGAAVTVPKHLSRHEATPPLIPLTNVNSEWTAFAHDKIVSHEKVVNATAENRGTVEAEYIKAKAIFEGTAEEGKKGRKAVDQNIDPLDRMTKTELVDFINRITPLKDTSPEKLKRKDVLAIAKDARKTVQDATEGV